MVIGLGDGIRTVSEGMSAVQRVREAAHLWSSGKASRLDDEIPLPRTSACPIEREVSPGTDAEIRAESELTRSAISSPGARYKLGVARQEDVGVRAVIWARVGD
jgi:hypothetical protein